MDIDSILNPTREVRAERTAWRDEKFSKLHRTFGYDCPVQDVDAMWIEYDTLQPVAFLETKAEGALIDLESPQCKLLKNTAAAANCYAFLIEYKNDMSEFKVYPIGTKAIIKTKGKVMSLNAVNLAKFQYWLRGRPFPEELTQKIEETVKNLQGQK